MSICELPVIGFRVLRRIKGKIFLDRTSIPKIGDCHAISFFQLYVGTK